MENRAEWPDWEPRNDVPLAGICNGPLFLEQAGNEWTESEPQRLEDTQKPGLRP